jgi:thiosulfate reductase cytochrome b subunit
VSPRLAGRLAWALWTLAMLGFLPGGWIDHLLREAGRPDLVSLDAATVPYLLALVSAATVGAVVASRRPAHPVGWLLLALGLSVTSSGLADQYVFYGLLARPGAVPAAAYVAVYGDASFILFAACIGFVLLLTPTGSLPSPRWRWWARVAAAAPAVFLLAAALRSKELEPPYPPIRSPLAVQALAGPAEVAAGLALAVTGLAVLVGAASLVLRFRRARGVERQQLKWMAFAAALALVAVAAVTVGAVMNEQAVVVGVSGVYMAVLPLAIGAAILRYRLYDLDRIVSRTLAYGLLTVLLGLGYAGVVLGLGRLLPQGSSLVVAAATLAVAGVFQPARRRVQQAVDRRFNRRRYDAARTIAAFSDRLRQQVDLDTLTAELLAVVEETVQPTRASLWLRPPAGRSAARP